MADEKFFLPGENDSPDDDPRFAGPVSGGKEKTLGKNRSLDKYTSKFRAKDGYYDIDRLRDNLDRIITNADNFINTAEGTMQGFNLHFNSDTNLAKAQEAEWPTELGPQQPYISYVQYKSMSQRVSRASDYIQRRYEESIRQPTGTPAFDFLVLAYVIKNEAVNISTFLDNYIGDINDSAEFRLLELFQEWTQNALFSQGEIQSKFTQRYVPQRISKAEMDKISSEGARRFQALFQIKVNSYNNDIASKMQELKKDFVDQSNLFYEHFLGPALRFRLDAGRDLPIDTTISSRGELYKHVQSTIGSLDANLTVLISDQSRRNSIFREGFREIGIGINERDRYNSYIRQLSTYGKTLSSPFKEEPPSPEELLFFLRDHDAPVDTGNQFLSSHDDVDDIENAVHNQHPLKTGDTFTGNIELEGDVTVGGIVPNTHEHSGEDGSAQISATNLVPGSLVNEIVDVGDSPPAPEGLVVSSVDMKLQQPGVPFADVTIEWKNALPDYFYEVQLIEEE